MSALALYRALPKVVAVTTWEHASMLARDLRIVLRDIIDAIDRPVGEMYVTDNSTALTMTTQNTWYQITANWLSGTSNRTSLVPVSGDIEMTSYAGMVDVLAHVSCFFSASGVYEFALFLGETQIEKSRQKLDGTINVVILSIGCVAEVLAGQALSLRVRCTSAAGRTVTVRDLNLRAVGI